MEHKQMNAASRIKVVHYAETDPKHDNKAVMALCGFRVNVKETTQDKEKVSCFLCHTKINP